MAWTVDDARELYNVSGWSAGLFDVNAQGHMTMVSDAGSIDLALLANDLVARGIDAPVLVRFTDVLRARVTSLCEVFNATIEEQGYRGNYRGVYPIKVNQQRQVVEEIVAHGRPYHFGLECGSKPELMITLAELDDPDAVIVCNGHKDRDFIEMALIGRKLGRRAIIVVEQPAELERVLEVADELDLPADIGVRVQMNTQGTGRWKESLGSRAKFGLSTSELLQVVERLREAGRLDWLTMLHCHIGSQISAIRQITAATREGARFFVELSRLGAPMTIFDIGGGLGIDYDGSKTNFESSMNYSMQEYAETIVSTLAEVCDQADIPHPTIVTEAGRALTAHASMLVVPVLGVTSPVVEAPTGAAERHASVSELEAIVTHLSIREPQRLFHKATEIRDNVLARFDLGLASLDERAAVDALYWRLAERLYTRLSEDGEIPEDLEVLERFGVDTYYCNFSVFQSLPDSWAIRQLFPIVPLQRLDVCPSRRGILADLTCDADGRVDRFVDVRDVKRALELHELNEDPYFLGVFLLGAYQEILGDLHNLFGDTNVVHVSAAPTPSGYRIEELIEGESVADVLEYVQYDHRRLYKQMRSTVERAYERGSLSVPEGRHLLKTYRLGLENYTYLD